jgi:acetyl-CoA synthetase
VTGSRRSAQGQGRDHADGGYRRGGLVPLKKNTDDALKECPQVHTVIVQADWPETGWQPDRDILVGRVREER